MKHFKYRPKYIDLHTLQFDHFSIFLYPKDEITTINV